MDYEVVQKPGFIVAGLSIRTTRQKANQEITHMWMNFFINKVKKAIPYRSDPEELLSVYLDHDEDIKRDGSGFYTAIAGCRISETYPSNRFTIKKIPAAKYAVFTARGKIPNITVDTWKKIHQMDLKRAFTGDFEVYSKGNFNLEDGEVKIYVSLL